MFLLELFTIFTFVICFKTNYSYYLSHHSVVLFVVTIHVIVILTLDKNFQENSRNNFIMNGVENRIIKRIVSDHCGASTDTERIIAILQIYDVALSRINRTTENNSSQLKRITAVLSSLSRTINDMNAQLGLQHSEINTENLIEGENEVQTSRNKNRRRRYRTKAKITWKSPYLGGDKWA